MTGHGGPLARLIKLPPNQPPDRFYLGGELIESFRSGTPEGRRGLRTPEDWVGSVTSVAGADSVGRTVLSDGYSLAESIRADPIAWLGPEHERSFGTNARLLVKLLDAGQRLPVHAHPDDAFSQRHQLGQLGKAEAWYILRGGDVYLGLKSLVSEEVLLRLVTEQRTDEMLRLLHRRRVEPGSVVYVPPGVLHSIGAGVLLLEVQQPTDLSILLEWRGFDLDGAKDGHLGLGFARALTAVDTRVHSSSQIDELVVTSVPGVSVLPRSADPFFRLERHIVGSHGVALDPGFAVLVVPKGDLRASSGEALGSGSTALLPYRAGPISFAGEGELLVCRPPLPSLTG